MTLIKINIENKDKVQQKSEILNKLNKIQTLVDNDRNYNELVYNIVTNATLHKKNIKVNLDNYGNYKVIDSKNKILSGGLFNSNANLKSNKNVSSMQVPVKASVSNNTKNNLTKSVQKVVKQEPEEDSEEQESSPEEDSEEEQEPSQVSEEDSEKEQETSPEEEHEKSSSSAPALEAVPIAPTEPTAPKSFWNTINPFKGGNKDHYSSDEESISFNKYQTMMFHNDDNDDNLMQHMKNMTNKKYLSNLTTQELKDIMKSNQMRVTNNGSYYNKKEMVGKIYNFYK